MPDDNDIIRFKPSEMARAIRGITTATVAATLTINRNGIYSLDMSESGFTKLIVRVDEENKYSSSAEDVTEEYYVTLDTSTFNPSIFTFTTSIDLGSNNNVDSIFNIDGIAFETNIDIVGS